MAKKPAGLWSFIGSAWTFFYKQPALYAVTVWFLVLPFWIATILVRLIRSQDLLSDTALHRFLVTYDPRGIVVIAFFVLLVLLVFWGGASIAVVGRRMVLNRAGRSRTSFLTASADGLPLLFPLFFTFLLRFAITFFLSLLFLIPAASMRESFMLPFLFPLLIPAFLYLLSTMFYVPIVCVDDLRYHHALQRSMYVIHGHFWSTVLKVIMLAVVWFLPGKLLALALDKAARMVDVRLLPLSDLAGVAVLSVGCALFLLSFILLYGQLRERPRNVKVPMES